MLPLAYLFTLPLALSLVAFAGAIRAEARVRARSAARTGR